MPAKLRVDGVDRTLRCEGRVDDGTVRLTATLPFLRLDGGVDVVLGEHGEVAARGVISKIAVDPVDRRRHAAAGPRRRAGRRRARQPYGAHRRAADGRDAAAHASCRPPCGHPLPSVVVSPGLERDVRLAEERPPRRRVHGTAEIARRPDGRTGPGRRRRSWSAGRASARARRARPQRLDRAHRRARRGPAHAAVVDEAFVAAGYL